MEVITFNDAGEKVNQLINKFGQNIQHCYQCGKCTAGCPVAFAMDIAPNQIIRMLQLGLLDEALRSETIWLCATCSTCSTRCPKGFDLAKLMDSLRSYALQQGIKPNGRGRNVSLFNQLFLDSLRKYGRTYEMGLMLKYNLNLHTPFKDAMLGLDMFSRGKLKLAPERIKGSKDILQIMENIKKLEMK
ncbi:putative heterodisulfide reductase, C subunit [Desulforamulus reducens MI-1]|uniref:Putative heterodisulfide reductase, C subunit n=1 Tax=Desulforamulus reducens (strain ATCC BAA-1160 / DSM 100696 / MI-1) TaxID=349161 RepID=A4J1F3_DESRM|nr:4Fe-4S dicluster domain-containing protein [Desulforamulus reducens]ABO48906.1 putative heterodisulfide reductase, C subunit [Desulforamulus reducens MI-1]